MGRNQMNDDKFWRGEADSSHMEGFISPLSQKTKLKLA